MAMVSVDLQLPTGESGA